MKAFGRLKTIDGEENIIAGCVICEENPDPSSYTELVGVEPKLEIVGNKYDDSSQKSKAGRKLTTWLLNWGQVLRLLLIF